MPKIDPKKIAEWRALCVEMDDLVARGECQDAGRTLNRAGALAATVPALLSEREELLALLREFGFTEDGICRDCGKGYRTNDGHAKACKPDCRLYAMLR